MAKKTHKPGNKGRRGGAQPGAGKPLKVISPTDMQKAEEYAFKGHKNGTICELMDWEPTWLEGRKDISKRFSKKRAERKVWLREQQDRIALGDSGAAAAVVIFLGKNELDQTDKQQHEISEDTLSAIIALAARIKGRGP